MCEVSGDVYHARVVAGRDLIQEIGGVILAPAVAGALAGRLPVADAVIRVAPVGTGPRIAAALHHGHRQYNSSKYTSLAS